jgi:cyclic pyranopterin phosphate synthase
VLSIARIAAIMAVKETPRAIPMCHQIPITSIKVDFSFEPDSIRAEVEVTTIGKTGVEMEALSGVSSALLNIWDMVKFMEKDETGNYPTTEIGDIVVLKKVKEQAS